MLFSAYLNAHQHRKAPCHRIPKNLLNERPLCRSNIMPSLLCVSISAERADFSTIGRVVKLPMPTSGGLGVAPLSIRRSGIANRSTPFVPHSCQSLKPHARSSKASVKTGGENYSSNELAGCEGLNSFISPLTTGQGYALGRVNCTR